MGLTKEQVKEIKENTIRAERLFDKYSDHPAFKPNVASKKISNLKKFLSSKPTRPKSSNKKTSSVLSNRRFDKPHI